MLSQQPPAEPENQEPQLLVTPVYKVLSHPLAPYVIPVLLWLLAWKLQALTSTFVTAPLGLDVIYFTLGARVFSILVFGLPGAIGLVFGSFIAFLLFESPQYPDPIWFLISYSVINTLSVYLIVKFFDNDQTPTNEIRGICIRRMLGIMLISGLVVSTIHEVFFRFVRLTPVSYDFGWDAFFMQTASRVIGGMLFVLLTLALGKLILSRNDQNNSNRLL